LGLQGLRQIGLTPTVTLEFQDQKDVTMESVLTALQKACVHPAACNMLPVARFAC
jgi:hypothetical protein